MKIHLCTESPCPVESKEIFDRLNNAFSSTYVNMGDGFYTCLHEGCELRILPDEGQFCPEHKEE